MENKIIQIAERIRGLRLIMDITPEEMANVTGVGTAEEYLEYEAGNRDFPINFLFNCSRRFGVEFAELTTGEVPKLNHFSVVRAGEGVPVERRKSLDYKHLGYLFKHKTAEPFFVTAKYDPADFEQDIPLSTHKGQEFDYILSGRLRLRIEGHILDLSPGDSIFFDSSHGHGMIALDGEDCDFIAIVMRES